MDSTTITTQEIDVEILPIIRTYKDGRVERIVETNIVPPSLEDGVQSKDILISPDTGVSARLYLPNVTNSSDLQKLPILVYFHGGGFCFGSAFSSLYHTYVNKLVARAKVVGVSVEYRLAPEFPLPAAYDDCWDALQWVLSHSNGQAGTDEPWLRMHGNFDRLFLGGDSAGANIIHNILMRDGEKSLNIFGAFMVQPYFCSSDQTKSDKLYPYGYDLSYRVWRLVSSDSIDDPKINPLGLNAPSLSSLGCDKVMISVAEKDSLKDIGILYHDALKKSGWKGEVTLFEVEGEPHVFHLYNPDCEKAEILMKCLDSFLNHP